MNNWPRIIQDWLFPPTCLLCGDPGMESRDLCAACADSLPFNRPACPRCGQPLPLQTDLPCGACQSRPPAFDAAFALLRYEEPARHLIRALKFDARHACARLLGELLADALAGRRELPELIIPVPLHPARYRRRGHNQSLDIARVLGRRIGIDVGHDTCIRVKDTQAQTELGAQERRRNMRHAFAMGKPLEKQHVAILDDVVTTGATAGELAQVLRKAGASRIEVWACARAAGPGSSG